MYSINLEHKSLNIYLNRTRFVKHWQRRLYDAIAINVYFSSSVYSFRSI